jgi:hypothetical protein
MAHRDVIDPDGFAWEVWDVEPELAEKRDADDPHPPETTGERRRTRSVRSRLPGTMKAGWLAMRCGSERRRIAPIPTGWLDMADVDLLALIARADSSTPVRRLIE